MANTFENIAKGIGGFALGAGEALAAHSPGYNQFKRNQAQDMAIDTQKMERWIKIAKDPSFSRDLRVNSLMQAFDTKPGKILLNRSTISLNKKWAEESIDKMDRQTILLTEEERRKGARISAGIEPIAKQQASPLQTATAGGESGLPKGTVFQTGPQGNVKVISQPQLLSPEEQRQGARIGAGIEPAVKSQAGELQTATPGDNSGLPEGTVFQKDPQGNVSVIAEPETLNFDEKRRVELIAGGLEPKAITELEKQIQQTTIEKNRAEISKLQATADGKLDAEGKVRVSTILRKEFDALSKDFRIMKNSFTKMNDAAKDPSGPGDIALIFNFMKILDPNSVVRESEFATAETAGSVPTTIWNMYNKAIRGERISINRQEFLKTARNLMEGQRKTQTDLIDRYTGLASRFGTKAQDVVTQLKNITQAAPIDELSEIEKEIAELEALQ